MHENASVLLNLISTFKVKRELTNTSGNAKKKRKRERYKKDADFKMFIGAKTHHRVVISAQMSLAILQFLATSVAVVFIRSWTISARDRGY